MNRIYFHHHFIFRDLPQVLFPWSILDQYIFWPSTGDITWSTIFNECCRIKIIFLIVRRTASALLSSVTPTPLPPPRKERQREQTLRGETRSFIFVYKLAPQTNPEILHAFFFLFFFSLFICFVLFFLFFSFVFSLCSLVIFFTLSPAILNLPRSTSP